MTAVKCNIIQVSVYANISIRKTSSIYSTRRFLNIIHIKIIN
nr:MAG TPA: hypothetical protein [Caudoviricetes sp.]